MAKRSPERTVRLSFLDRIIEDSEPRSWSDSAQRMRRAVRRDLEWLLNTRQTPVPVLEGQDHLDASLFNYGLPDISSMSADSPDSPRQLARDVRLAIQRYEPRLSGVRVTISEDEDNPLKRELRFRVEATLEMDPNPEKIVFDTVLEVGSGAFLIEGGG